MKKYISVISKVVNKLYLIFAVLVVLTAVLVTFARALTPILTRYKSDITHKVELYLGQKIDIAKIRAGMRGFQPVLDLHDVTIYAKNTDKVVFRVHDLQVGFDLFKSLQARKVIVSRLYINGMRVAIYQNANKRWQVQGFSHEHASSQRGNFNFKDVISWLLSQPQLVLENINLQIRPYQRRIHQISDVDVLLSNSDDLHRLRGQANLLGHQSPVDVAVDLKGHANAVDQLTGTFYLKAVNTPFANWLEDNKFFGFKTQSGNFSFQLWGDWRKQTINNLQAKVDFSQLQFQVAKQQSYVVNKLQANLAFRRFTPQRWQLTGDKVDITINNHHWPQDHFYVAENRQQETQLNVYTEFLDLGDLSEVMQHLTVIPELQRNLFRHLVMQGQLHKTAVQVRYANKHLEYQGHGDFNEIAWQPYRKLPGVSGLNGSITLNNHMGQVKLESQQANVSYSHLFNDIFALKQLKAQAQWQQTKQGLQLQIFNTTLDDGNINVQSNATLWLAKKASQSSIALLANYHLKNSGEVNHYLPNKIFPEKLQNWFAKAFVSGKAANGKVVLRGKLKDYPFRDHAGQYQFKSKLNDMTFHFAPGWQPIQHLSGMLLFEEGSLFFKATRADILQQSAQQLTAYVKNLGEKPQAWLKIKALLQVNSLANAKQYLLESPLKKTLGKSLAPLDFQGNGSLNLDLNIPLHHGKTAINGKLNIAQANLKIPDWRLEFTHLKGALGFTNDSLRADNLQALLFNQPAKITIKTLLKNQQRTTQFSMSTKLAMQTVKDYFSLQALKFIKGVTKATANLDIYQGGKSQLTLVSSLDGVVIDAPAPFAKLAKQKKDFQVDAYLNNDKPPLIRLSYERLLGAALAFKQKDNKMTFDRAVIHLGDGGYLLQKQAGIYLTGHLAKFDWSVWSKFREKIIGWIKSTSKKTQVSSSKNLIKRVDVHVDLIEAMQQTLTSTHLTIQHDANQWLANIASDEISGTLSVPTDAKKVITGDFGHLALVPLTHKKSVGDFVVQPEKLPAIDFDAADFSYGKTHFGKVTLRMQPIKQGVDVEQLSIINKLYVLNTKGRWTAEKGKDNSSFSGSLYTQNLGQLLQQENFTSHIYKTNGSANFNLTWPAKPTDFQTKSIQGSIKLNFNNGAIVGLSDSTNQKIGLGKIVNILSVQSILKRVTLNFSDLDKSGYSFDTLTGDITLADGNVYSQNLYMDGSVAEIHVKGKVGLLNKTYDLNLQINPYVTSSLPLIATIAGGPVAGIATWAVSKLARAGIEKVVDYKYHIGGTWKDPAIKDLNKKPASKNSSNKPVKEAV